MVTLAILFNDNGKSCSILCNIIVLDSESGVHRECVFMGMDFIPL